MPARGKSEEGGFVLRPSFYTTAEGRSHTSSTVGRAAARIATLASQPDEQTEQTVIAQQVPMVSTPRSTGVARAAGNWLLLCL